MSFSDWAAVLLLHLLALLLATIVNVVEIGSRGAERPRRLARGREAGHVWAQSSDVPRAESDRGGAHFDGDCNGRARRRGNAGLVVAPPRVAVPTAR